MPLLPIAQEFPKNFEAWPTARLKAWQMERVREVVTYARERLPFYRRLWTQAGVGEREPALFEDFQRFPIQTKQDLVKAGNEWVNPNKGPVGFGTRGTSGEPLLVWLNSEEQEVYIRPTIRGFKWAGFKSGMTAMLMSPVWHRLAASEAHAVTRLGGRCVFFWGSMGSQYIDSFLKTLCDVRPEFLTTTSPFLLSVIRRGEEVGMDLMKAFRSVHSIVAVGLALTPRLREFLRDRAGVDDVFERAGTQEGAALDECGAHAMTHVHEDVCYLEVVDGDGNPVEPGTRGNLVVTKLATGGSIFVRYNTEDIAAFIPGPCSCGINFRRLKIYGRPESSVVVGGKRVTAYDVRLCVEEDPALIGRNVLLVREGQAPSTPLSVAIEGAATGAAQLEQRLQNRLEVQSVRINWLGDLKIAWGFRQVIDRLELSSTTR